MYGKKRFLIIIALLLFVNCLQYNVDVSFDHLKGANIKNQIFIDKSFLSITDSILNTENVNDSFVISENDSIIIVEKTTFIKIDSLKKYNINYYKTQDEYFIEIEPNSNIFLFNLDKKKEIFLNSFTIAIHITDGEIIKHNGDSLIDNTVYYTINSMNFANKSKFPFIRVRFGSRMKNYFLLFLFFLISSGLIVFLIANKRDNK